MDFGLGLAIFVYEFLIIPFLPGFLVALIFFSKKFSKKKKPLRFFLSFLLSVLCGLIGWYAFPFLQAYNDNSDKQLHMYNLNWMTSSMGITGFVMAWFIFSIKNKRNFAYIHSTLLRIILSLLFAGFIGYIYYTTHYSTFIQS